MNVFKRFLSMFLVLCMLISVCPMTTYAAETDGTDPTAAETTQETPVADEETTEVTEETTEATEETKGATEAALVVNEASVEEETEITAYSDAKAAEISEFVRAFSLDCGRIYFSVDQIETIIDLLAANDYTHLALAFGNSGFRFLLDDMAVGNYSSDDVKNAILAGNSNYATNDGHNGSSAANTCLTQTEMDTIISYANSKGISIIPVLNSPGHMNTIVYAMGQLGISNAGYPVTNSYNSESTININDTTVTAFVNALIQKYITYFAGKGCTMFNMGADEFANDPTDDSQLG
ncbi:MAG: family 20 glycosylhydrolase, partial [Tyzzerella sp.]|nr:family 20 glycosylhydrolase [Tyzzerella sp.]